MQSTGREQPYSACQCQDEEAGEWGGAAPCCTLGRPSHLSAYVGRMWDELAHVGARACVWIRSVDMECGHGVTGGVTEEYRWAYAQQDTCGCR
eukprot:363863-Chlamydomonas_euryale.AAC.9